MTLEKQRDELRISCGKRRMNLKFANVDNVLKRKVQYSEVKEIINVKKRKHKGI